MGETKLKPHGWSHESLSRWAINDYSVKRLVANLSHVFSAHAYSRNH